MTLNGATLAIRAFASVSRYYPQIVRYYLFIKDMQKIDKIPLAEVRRGDKVFLGTLPNGQDVVVEAGDRLAMLATGSTTRADVCAGRRQAGAVRRTRCLGRHRSRQYPQDPGGDHAHLWQQAPQGGGAALPTCSTSSRTR